MAAQKARALQGMRMAQASGSSMVSTKTCRAHRGADVGCVETLPDRVASERLIRNVLADG